MHLQFCLVPLIFVLAANAVNDWTRPCFNGRCAHDLEASNSRAAGSLILSGSPSAISDLTQAAGWMVLDCDTDSMNQDIRVVCMDETPDGCSHLYNDGAVDTLVRLPQDCGKGPFARLAREWDHEDQSMPNSSLIVRRQDGSLPVIKGMTIDTNFSAIDPSNKGPVLLNIIASNVPGVNSSVTAVQSTPQRRSRLNHHRRMHRRGFGDFFGNTLADLTSFDENQTKDLPPTNISGTFNVFNSSLTCDSFNIAADINVDANINTVVSVGVTAKGSIVPPKLDEFALVTGLDADIWGTLDIITNATGTISSGTITLFEVGIPGLDIPGILSVGPSLKLNALAQATLDVDVDLKVDFGYKLNNTKLFFPPETMDSSACVDPSQSNLQLSAGSTVNSTTSLELHIIPTINFGISALGVIKATVFVDVDTSTTLILDLDATADNSMSSDNTTDPSFSGSVELDAGFAINIGADNSFLGLFHDTSAKTLFSEDFQLFKKDFGGSPAKREPVLSTIGDFAVVPRHLEKRVDFTCPSSSPALPALIVNSIVNGIKKIAGQ